MKLETLAIIPARGGSKGIPRKNLRLLGDKPLISYAIEATLQSERVNRVMVSTDDSDIIKVSKQYGAEIVRRPAELSGDKASSELALIHALNYLKKNENYIPDFTVFVQCTSPLILPDDIDGTFQALLNENSDTALTVFPFHGFIWKKDSVNNAISVNHNLSKRFRRQDIEIQYQEAGSVYVMKTKGLLDAKNRFFGKAALHVIPVERSIEIDNLADFNIAELLVKQIEITNKIKYKRIKG